MTGFNSKRDAAADKLHWSDCAVHNGPAYPAGECDCGAAQKPVAWAVQGCSKMWLGEFAEIDAKAEAKRIGGTCVAYALYK